MKTYLPLLLILLPLHAHAEWEHIPGTEVIGRVHLLNSDGDRLYAVGNTGFYLSFDDGYTWRRRVIGRGIEDFYITAIGSGDGAVYVGTREHGVFRSDNGGNTWVHINEGLHIFDDPTWGPRHGEVRQILVTSSGMVINVAYHQGTHISQNRGDTWHSVYDEWIYSRNKERKTRDWHIGGGIFAMTEFDGYLWAVWSSTSEIIFRSPDKGDTWEVLPNLKYGEIADWAVFDDRLYVAGSRGFGRWNEAEFMWEHLFRRRFRSTKRLYGDGLPESLWLNSLAVHRNRFFAGSRRHGVFMFDPHAETWRPAGLPDRSISRGGLVTHRGDLYAASEGGIYRANLQFVTPEGKAVVTWGAIKLEK